MKKALSIILAILMITASIPFAFAAETVIKPFEPVSVTVSETKSTVLKFVPEKTAKYYVVSYAADDVDPYAIIEDVANNDILTIDDTEDDYNFFAKYEFVAGNVYYITVCSYSEGTATFDVVLECVHTFEEDVCTTCEMVCDHTTEGKRFNTCECGKESDCRAIAIGYKINTIVDASKPVWYRFVPDEDVSAVLYSDVYDYEAVSGFDVSAKIFNADGDEVAYNDDCCGSYDFAVFYTFEAGEAYYLEISSYYEELEVDFFFVLAQHTTEDGEVHDVVFVPSNSNDVCLGAVYTDGVYCAECDYYFIGHEETDNRFCCDDDLDNYCDYCGEYMGTDEDDADVEEDSAADGVSSGFLGFIEILIGLIKSLVRFLFVYLSFALN